MILTFKHKGLKEIFQKGHTNKVNQKHVRKIRQILFVLHNAKELRDINFPGSNLHNLKGELKNLFAVKVSGNWRITFKFIEENVYEIDYIDYH